MSPEALARLRKDLADQVAPSRDDLRALLDAYAALEAEFKTRAGEWADAQRVFLAAEAAHTEALDALQAKMDILATTTLMSYADADTYEADVDVRVEAVLAKAGRR